MTKALLAAAAAVALVQLLPLRFPEEDRLHVYYIVPIAALSFFLAGLALAARGLRPPPIVLVSTALAGVGIAHAAAPVWPLLPPPAELLVHLASAALLGIGLLWLIKQHWRQSRTAGALLFSGVAVGLLVFLHSALARYAAYYESQSAGLAGIVAWAWEFAVGYGIGGLAAVTSAVAGARRAA